MKFKCDGKDKNSEEMKYIEKSPSSEYLDHEIAAISQPLVQDPEPFLLNKCFLKHKVQVPQYTDLCD